MIDTIMPMGSTVGMDHGPSLLWVEFVWAEFAMGRVCYGS